MLDTLRIAVRTTLLTLLVTGLLYPLGMTLLAQLAVFPSRAHGSLVTDEKGQVVGSALIGQRFRVSQRIFNRAHRQPGELGYDAAASSGSNLGPSSHKLRARVQAELRALTQKTTHRRPVLPSP
jgi:K+-transporting ATPase ATPase C chain